MFVLASCQFFHWARFDVRFLFFQMEPFEHSSMRGRLSPKNGMAFEVCRISTTVFCNLFIVYVMFMYICFSCFTTRNYSALRAPPLLAPAPEGYSARKLRLHPRCARMESPTAVGYSDGYHESSTPWTPPWRPSRLPPSLQAHLM